MNLQQNKGVLLKLLPKLDTELKQENQQVIKLPIINLTFLKKIFIHSLNT